MLNFLDILFIIPLAWLGWKGFSKGLIVELSTLVALLLGIWAALKFSHLTATWLADDLDFHSQYNQLIAFSLTFLAVVLGVNLLGKMLSKLAGMVMMAWLDKLAGTVFGLLKAAFIVSVILFIINAFDKDEALITPEAKEDSYLYTPVQKIAPAVFPYLKRENLEKIIPGDEELPELPHIAV